MNLNPVIPSGMASIESLPELAAAQLPDLSSDSAPVAPGKDSQITETEEPDLDIMVEQIRTWLRRISQDSIPTNLRENRINPEGELPGTGLLEAFRYFLRHPTECPDNSTAIGRGWKAMYRAVRFGRVRQYPGPETSGRVENREPFWEERIPPYFNPEWSLQLRGVSWDEEVNPDWAPKFHTLEELTGLNITELIAASKPGNPHLEEINRKKKIFPGPIPGNLSDIAEVAVSLIDALEPAKALSDDDLPLVKPRGKASKGSGKPPRKRSASVMTTSIPKFTPPDSSQTHSAKVSHTPLQEAVPDSDIGEAEPGEIVEVADNKRERSRSVRSKTGPTSPGPVPETPNEESSESLRRSSRLEETASRAKSASPFHVTPEYADRLRGGVVRTQSFQPILQTVRGTTEGMLSRMSAEERAYLEEESRSLNLNPTNPWTLAIRGHPIREGGKVHKLWPTSEFLESPEWYGACCDRDSRGYWISDKKIYPGIPSRWKSVMIIRKPGFSGERVCGGCRELEVNYSVKLRKYNRDWEEISKRQESSMQVDCSLGVKTSDQPWAKLFTHVPACLHTCHMATAVNMDTRIFAISRGREFTEGLGAHSVGLRLRIGVNLPWGIPGKKYVSILPVWGFLPLKGLLEYYWGENIVLQGKVRICWETDEKGLWECVPLMGGVSVESTSIIANHLRYEPIDIRIHPSFGPREDACLSYLNLQWLGTFKEPTEASTVPDYVPGFPAVLLVSLRSNPL